MTGPLAHLRALGIGVLTAGLLIGVPYTIWVDRSGLDGTVVSVVFGIVFVVAAYVLARGERS